MANFTFLHSKQGHPGSPFFFHDHKKDFEMNVKLKEIYNGLVDIAFEMQENKNLNVTQFVNVQSHREWTEAIINGKEIAIRIWSRSMGNGLNHHNYNRIAHSH